MAQIVEVKEGNRIFRTTHRTMKKIEKVMQSLRNGGSILAACDAEHLGRSTFYDYLEKAPGAQEEMDRIFDSRTNVVVDCLFKNCLKGDSSAQKFWLANRNKNKWAEQHRIDLLSSDGSMSPKKADIQKLSDEDLKKIEEIISAKDKDVPTNTLPT